MICSVYKPVVYLVETWLDSSIDDIEISIHGYNLIVRLDCSRHGGGTLIYVSNCSLYSVLFSGSPEFEFLGISCKSSPQSPDFYLAHLMSSKHKYFVTRYFIFYFVQLNP